MFSGYQIINYNDAVILLRLFLTDLKDGFLFFTLMEWNCSEVQ